MRYADKECVCIEHFLPHGYIFVGKCIVTSKIVQVSVPGEELIAYRKGKRIQKAMPSVSASDREFLISGISEEGWKHIMRATKRKKQVTILSYATSMVQNYRRMYKERYGVLPTRCTGEQIWHICNTVFDDTDRAAEDSARLEAMRELEKGNG